MTSTIQEGQEIGGRYQLLSPVAKGSQGDAAPVQWLADQWLALDSVSSDRVLLSLFPHSDESEALLRDAAQKVRGLIHPNIQRINDVGVQDSYLFAAQPYVRNTTTLHERGGSFRTLWPLLKELMTTLEFAHGAGVAHGNIHHDNLHVTPEGHVIVSSFGLPPSLVKKDASPQADVADDVHSLGILLYQALTGHAWSNGQTFESNAPVSLPVRQLLTQMLDENSYARPSDLKEIRDILEVEAEGSGASDLGAGGNFQRATAPQAPVAPTTNITQGTSAAHVPTRDQQQLPMGIVATGLAVLLVLAAFVFFVLPEGASPTATSPNTAQHTPAPPPPAVSTQTTEASETLQLSPLELAQMQRFEDEGKELASAIVRKQVELEDAGVQMWANNEFGQLVSRAEDADAMYRDEAFDKALAAYREVLEELTQLQDRIPQILEEAVAAGEQALQQEDSQAAITNWTIATALAPEVVDYEAQLARAVNLDAVLGHLDSAQAMAANGELQNAKAEYVAAVNLDPMMVRATDGLARINERITQRRFRDAMSEGFSYLAEKNYVPAREAFARAADILPNSNEPADGLLQIDIAERMDTVRRHRDAAESAINNEDWQAAIDAYEAARTLDPTLLFASEGIEKATARLALQEEMQPFLTQPDAMQDDEGLAQAKSLLVQASRVRDAGPKLREDLTRLSTLISVARIPVRVMITSDNRTDVTVYKIGNLGTIDQTSLDLVPGRYTVVGKRRGYRDVREDFTVIGGQAPASVHVSCTEKV